MNNSDCTKLEIDEVGGILLGPEVLGRRREAYFEKCDKRRQKNEVFSVKEKGKHPVASKWRWDDCHGQRKSQEEKAWKEGQGLEEEVVYRL